MIANGTLRITGTGNANTELALRLRMGDPTTLEVDIGNDGSADFSFDRALFDHIVVKAGAGDDVIRIDEANGIFTDTEITTLDGGNGNDTLIGGSGAETLIGGPGNDTIDGNKGNDIVFLGAGDDTFIWDPGDGSDVVEGDQGADVMVFNGANVAENIDLSANGKRLRFTRNVGTITMDLNGVEQIDFNALGGEDNVVVNDLAGTDVKHVNVNLAGTLGGNAGDGAADSVFINGTVEIDTFDISADAGAVVVDGLAAQVRVKGFEPEDRVVVDGVGGDVVNVNGSAANDTMVVTANAPFARVTATGFSAAVDVSGPVRLSLNGLAGDDTISASGDLAALGIALVLDGGEGNDVINGGNGNDLLIGGPGNDIIDGNQGSDTAFLGDGDDTFIWDPGDGSDVVEGEGGDDVMVFNGANIAENIDLSADGQRLRFTRNVGTITMDLDGVERVDFNALGGADNVVVNDLTGTAVKHVNVNLASTLGGNAGDNAVDSVFVNGTADPDTINISADAGAVFVDGLAVDVRVKGFEPDDRVVIDGVGGDLVNVNGSAGNDIMQVAPSGTFARVTATGFSTAVDVSGALTLSVNGLGGNDTISASGNLAALGIPLQFDGGEGNDVINGSNGADTLIGGPGNDTIDGNQGNDIAFLGDGDDTFIWDPGDGSDVVEGGERTMVFNGANIAENIDLSANGRDCVHPQCGHHHHGPGRRGARGLQRPGRDRQRSRARPDRHGSDPGERRSGRHPRRRYRRQRRGFDHGKRDSGSGHDQHRVQCGSRRSIRSRRNGPDLAPGTGQRCAHRQRPGRRGHDHARRRCSGPHHPDY
jgi:Ca2+-binding RTX toxin-like protein